ncbi:MAG: hypothetical protein WB809_04075 [Thermoplasmata archaeon]
MEPPWPGARIFLSSGQTEGTPEADLVIDVQHKLEDLGFEVTIATGTTVPRGVWPEILRRLRESEYFILIDFRRRGLPGRPLPDGWNRSLVSHQELAVALSHETPFLAFTEEGMLGRVGALRMVPSATIQFKRSNLVQKVQEAVSSAIWRPDWRNELQLTRTTRDSDNQDWVRFGPGPTYLGAKYYQIGVRNANGTTLATDVHAFLESWSGGPSRRRTVLSPLLELKWDAVAPRTVSIPAGTTRRFSAIILFKHEPGVAQLGVNFLLIDSNAFREECRFTPTGKYRMNFVVYSREFAPARQTFELRLGLDPEHTELVRLRRGAPGS